MKKFDHYRSGNWDGKPYNFFGDYLKNKYGCRVLKLPINARLSCPNRDGTLSRRGCTFCGEDGSASPTVKGEDDIAAQMLAAKNAFRRNEADTRYIAYFQAYTNTYAPVSDLKRLYDRALQFTDVTGLMIGTRPDELSDDVLDLIASYKRENFELWLEIGMQSSHNAGLSRLNRGHTHEQTVDAITRAAASGIPVCVHIILGIPGESWEDMMETAREISSLPVQGVKIHHLHVIKGTQLDTLYRRGEIPLFTLEEYVSLLCDFLERINPGIIIHRLMGDREEKSLAAPLWALHKGTVLKAINEQFANRGTFQGFLTRPID